MSSALIKVAILLSAAGLAGLGGYNWGRSSGYIAGEKAGIQVAQNNCKLEKDRLAADSNAEAERVKRVAQEWAAQVAEAARNRRAEAEKRYAEGLSRSNAAIDDLRRRLRVAAARDSLRQQGSASGVPEAARSVPDLGGASYAEWLVHPAGGERIVELAQFAEREFERLRLCGAASAVAPAAESLK